MAVSRVSFSIVAICLILGATLQGSSAALIPNAFSTSINKGSLSVVTAQTESGNGGFIIYRAVPPVGQSYNPGAYMVDFGFDSAIVRQPHQYNTVFCPNPAVGKSNTIVTVATTNFSVGRYRITGVTIGVSGNGSGINIQVNYVFC